MGRSRRMARCLTKGMVLDMVCNLFVLNPGREYTAKEIFRKLELKTHPHKMLAMDALEQLSQCGDIRKKGDASYVLNLADNVLEGRFVRRANGRHSFIPDGGGDPVPIYEDNTLHALTGDRVKVACLASPMGHGTHAIVVEILSRARETFAGRLVVKRDFGYLRMDSEELPSDLIIPRNRLKGGATGDKVVVRVRQWPSDEDDKIVGEVVDVLGKTGDNDVEMHSILVQYGLPYKYPERVEEAANAIPGEITEEDRAGREDFREVTTFTIDPHDAKDFDDALSIREAGDGLWEVGVHIADVSHYVTEGSIIDKEAQRRATSVYLVDRTVPMLPERLCNFVCSLRPGEEKLTYSAVFIIDIEGNVSDWRLVHAVIRSDRRFAYEEVQEILETNGVVDGTGEPAPAPGKDGYRGEFARELVTLDRIAKSLRAARFRNGSIKFDREELRFDIDENGKPTCCHYKRSKDANKLIEEFMLLANRHVAESVGKAGKGGKAKTKTLPYRIHEEPDPFKLETLGRFVKSFGYKLNTHGSSAAIAKGINDLMDRCNGKAEQKAIEAVALRAMMKARYSVYNKGHYGLAFPYYTHFTSPIRRYPDLMVHRLLTRYADGGRSGNKDYYEQLCEHSSEMEQLAQNAERESIKYKMVEFMSDKIGKVYDAHISGIAPHGLYCEIDENHCEGLVFVSEIDDDYYDFDERNFCLRGRRYGEVFRLGDAVRIRVASANLAKRQLNFVFPDRFF